MPSRHIEMALSEGFNHDRRFFALSAAEERMLTFQPNTLEICPHLVERFYTLTSRRIISQIRPLRPTASYPWSGVFRRRCRSRVECYLGRSDFNTTLWFDACSSCTLRNSSALKRRQVQIRWMPHTVALWLVSSASTTIDCMATCSSQSRSLVVDRTISSSADSTHQLCSFDAFEALQSSVLFPEKGTLCSHSVHTRSSFEQHRANTVSRAQQPRDTMKSKLSHTFPL